MGGGLGRVLQAFLEDPGLHQDEADDGNHESVEAPARDDARQHGVHHSRCPQFYRNDDESTPPFKMANAFFQDVADIGAAAKAKNWPRAQEKYEAATLKLAEWKRLVNY